MSERARKSKIFYDRWAFKPWSFGIIGVIDELHDEQFNKHQENDRWICDDCVISFSLDVSPLDETDEVFDKFIELASEYYQKNGLEFKLLGVERYGRKTTVKKYFLAAIPRMPNLDDSKHIELLSELWDKALDGRYGKVAQKGFDHSYSFDYLLANTVTRNRDQNGNCAFAFVSYGIDDERIKEVSDHLDSREEAYEEWADIEEG